MKLLTALLPLLLCALCVLMCAMPARAAEPEQVIVAYKTQNKAQYSSWHVGKEFAQRLSDVLGTNVKIQPFSDKLPDAKLTILLTNAAEVGGEVEASLKDKALDAFTIRYPYEYEGRTVCVLASRDERGEDYPAYFFLKKFLDVHYVGPSELGVVWEQKPGWQIPDSINIIESPDFEMRLWTGASFTSRPWLARSSRMGFHHALGVIFSAKQHGDKPDVYPLINGKRYIPDPTHHSTSGWQPCTSDPLSIEIAKNHVLEQLENNPHLISSSLSVNDGAGNICECDECVALDLPKDQRRYSRDYANRFFTFYNKVAEEVVKVNPKAQVAVLGYGPCKMPPVGFKVHPHVQVFKVNPTPEELHGWKESGAGVNIYFWLWDGGFMTVRPDMQSLNELIQISHESGGLGVYSEIIAQWVVSAPKFYVLANILWDADRDYTQVLGEYCDLAYGENAGPIMRQWFEHWHSIHRRYEVPYNNVTGWRRTEQFENLRRSDLVILQELIDRAQAAEKSPNQAKRLELLAAHHEFMTANADQYITARELSDPQWLQSKSNTEILAHIELSSNLTDRVNDIWEKYYANDTTGWMLDPKRDGTAQDFWNQWNVQVRSIVQSDHESAIVDALAFVTDRLQGTDEQKLAFWKTQQKARPSIGMWVNSRMRVLQGEELKDVVTNGNFEDASAGDTPYVPNVRGWLVYEQYGSVQSSKNLYSVETGTGRDGGRALGIGEGLYGELRTFFQLEEGKRYAVTFWHKTENRAENDGFWIYGYEEKSGEDKPEISRFFRLDLEPTDGEWVRVTRTIVANRTGTFMTQFSSYRHDKDEWTWFDDFEIRER